MNVNDIFPSRFVKAHDLGDKEVTVTVKSATMEDMGHGAEKETKLCIWFERATKGFVLNKTNAMIIASMYGPETDNWKGKAITIYSARVKAFGAWHDAVRVKEQIPARNVGAARIPDAMQEAPPIDDEEDLLDVDEGGSENAQPGPSVAVDVDFGMGKQPAQDNPFNDSTSYYVRDWNKLTGKQYDLVKWVATLHHKSDGPCTRDQYGYLVGVMDDLIGEPNDYALSLLCQSEITTSNMPGRKVADNLLKLLSPTLTDSNAPNPDYRADMAEMITAIALDGITIQPVAV